MKRSTVAVLFLISISMVSLNLLVSNQNLFYFAGSIDDDGLNFAMNVALTYGDYTTLEFDFLMTINDDPEVYELRMYTITSLIIKLGETEFRLVDIIGQVTDPSDQLFTSLTTTLPKSLYVYEQVAIEVNFDRLDLSSDQIYYDNESAQSKTLFAYNDTVQIWLYAILGVTILLLLFIPVLVKKSYREFYLALLSDTLSSEQAPTPEEQATLIFSYQDIPSSSSYNTYFRLIVPPLLTFGVVFPVKLIQASHIFIYILLLILIPSGTMVGSFFIIATMSTKNQEATKSTNVYWDSEFLFVRVSQAGRTKEMVWEKQQILKFTIFPVIITGNRTERVVNHGFTHYSLHIVEKEHAVAMRSASILTVPKDSQKELEALTTSLQGLGFVVEAGIQSIESRVQDIMCPNCRKVQSSHNNFCIRCGTSFDF